MITPANQLAAAAVAIILYPIAIWFCLLWAVRRHVPDNQQLSPRREDDEGCAHGEVQ